MKSTTIMPFVVGIPAIVLCIVQIALDIRASRRKSVEVEDTRSDVVKAQDEVSRYAGRAVESEAATVDVPVMDMAGVPPNSVRREVILWTFFLSFVVGILLFGFWVSIPIFLVTYLRKEAGLSWLRALHEGFIVTYLLDQLGM
jgi:hypothetical protein